MFATSVSSTITPPDVTPDSMSAVPRIRGVRRVLAAVHTDAPRLTPVLRVATRLATVRRSRLTVATVLGTPFMPDGVANVNDETSTAWNLHRTEALLFRAIAQTDPDYCIEPKRSMCDIQVVTGDPDYEIPSLLHALNADVLLIGRGEIGQGGKVLSVLLRGMRAARVCETSPIPVIAVAEPQDQRHPLDTVVIATDFSSASWNAAVMAVQAAPPGARIHVVNVVDDRAMDPTVSAAEHGAAQATLVSWAAPLIALLPTGATLQTTVLGGAPYETLANFLVTTGATCVAVGGHRPRHNTISVIGRTVPERLLAAWSGTIVVGPHLEVTGHDQLQS